MTVNEIKTTLKQRKMTYSDLSEVTGVPLNTIRRIMCGQTPNPRFDTMQKINKALELEDKNQLAQNYYTEEEDFIIQTYRKLSKRDKTLVFNLFSSLTANDSAKTQKY